MCIAETCASCVIKVYNAVFIFNIMNNVSPPLWYHQTLLPNDLLTLSKLLE